MKIEVTFNNGKFVEFPCVKENTIKIDSNKNWSFNYGKNGSTAIIIMNNVNYMEIIKKEYWLALKESNCSLF